MAALRKRASLISLPALAVERRVPSRDALSMLANATAGTVSSTTLLTSHDSDVIREVINPG